MLYFFYNLYLPQTYKTPNSPLHCTFSQVLKRFLNFAGAIRNNNSCHKQAVTKGTNYEQLWAYTLYTLHHGFQ